MPNINKDAIVTLFVVAVSYVSLINMGSIYPVENRATVVLADTGRSGGTSLYFDPTVVAACGVSTSDTETFMSELGELIQSGPRPFSSGALLHTVSTFLGNPKIQTLINASQLRSYCFDPGTESTLIAFYNGGNLPANNTIGYFEGRTGELTVTTARSGPSRDDYEPCRIVGRTARHALFSCSYWNTEGGENASIISIERSTGKVLQISDQPAATPIKDAQSLEE